MKVCTGCGMTKQTDEFHRFKHSPDGRVPRCKDCRRPEMRAYYVATRERQLADRREKYQRDPVGARAANAIWKNRNPERHRFLQRRSHLKNQYNLTPEGYDTLLAAQGNACGLCRKPAGDQRLNVDHDHTCCPGKRSCGKCVRGLLCRPCNRLLGWFDGHRDAIAAYLSGRSG